jgi:hypothetical protein
MSIPQCKTKRRPRQQGALCRESPNRTCSREPRARLRRTRPPLHRRRRFGVSEPVRSFRTSIPGRTNGRWRRQSHSLHRNRGCGSSSTVERSTASVSFIGWSIVSGGGQGRQLARVTNDIGGRPYGRSSSFIGSISPSPLRIHGTLNTMPTINPAPTPAAAARANIDEFGTSIVAKKPPPMHRLLNSSALSSRRVVMVILMPGGGCRIALIETEASGHSRCV